MSATHRGQRVVVTSPGRFGRRGFVVAVRLQSALVRLELDDGALGDVASIPRSCLVDAEKFDAERRPRERHELPAFCWDPSRPLVVSTLYLESYEP